MSQSHFPIQDIPRLAQVGSSDAGSDIAIFTYPQDQKQPLTEAQPVAKTSDGMVGSKPEVDL